MTGFTIKRLFPGVFLFVLLFAIGLIPGRADYSGSISGIVTDESSQQPISGAYITVIRYVDGQNLAYATTQANGSFSVSNLPLNVEFFVQVSATGYTSMYFGGSSNKNYASLITLNPQQSSRSNINVSVNAGGMISGRVTNTSDIGVADMEVVIAADTDAWITTCTNGSGFYSLTQIPYDLTFHIYLSGKDCSTSTRLYAAQYYGGTPTRNGATTFILDGFRNSVTNVDFVVEAGGTVSGYALDSNGAAMENMQVALRRLDAGYFYDYESTACTNANGFYIHQNVAFDVPYMAYFTGYDCNFNGSYVPEYFEHKYTDAAASVIMITEHNPLREDVNFTVIQGSTVSGFVRDASVTPLDNQRVAAFIYNGVQWVKVGDTCTQANGSYQIDRLPFASYLAVRASGADCSSPVHPLYVPQSYNAKSYAQQPNVLIYYTPAGQTGVNFTLADGGTITGAITDVNGPVDQVAVRLEDTQGRWITETCTESDGTYSIGGVPFDTDVEVVVPGEGCTMSSRAYQSGSSSTLNLNSGSPVQNNVDLALTFRIVAEPTDPDMWTDEPLPPNISQWTPTPDRCLTGSIGFEFISFQSNGVVKMRFVNGNPHIAGQPTVFLTGMNIVWPDPADVEQFGQDLTGVLTLNSVIFDGSTPGAGTILWHGKNDWNDGSNNGDRVPNTTHDDPNTLSWNDGYAINYITTQRNFWFDFEGTSGLLSADFGITAEMFSGSYIDVTCEGNPMRVYMSIPQGDYTQASSTPLNAATPTPPAATDTPTPTFTPSETHTWTPSPTYTHTWTPGGPTATYTPSFTPSLTNVSPTQTTTPSPTRTPTATFDPTQGPPPPQAPANLRVDVEFGRPTIIWDYDGLAQWVHMYNGNANYSVILLNEWKHMDDLCDDTTCTYSPDIYPVGGTYHVWMQTWGQGGYSIGGDSGVSGWSTADFELPIELPGPVQTMTATVAGDGTVTFSWQAIQGATWYNVWAGEGSPTWTQHYNAWSFAGWLNCWTGTCTWSSSTQTVFAIGDLQFPPGEYLWYIRSWGPGGMSSGGVFGAEEWAQGPNFIVP